MTFVYLICFIVAIIGIALLLKLTPDTITNDIMRISTPNLLFERRFLLLKAERNHGNSLSSLTVFVMLLKSQEKGIISLSHAQPLFCLWW